MTTQERDEAALRSLLTRAMGREGTLMAQRIINGEALNTDDVERMFNTVIAPSLTATATEQAGRVALSVGLDAPVVNAEAATWARDYSYNLVRGLTDTTRQVVSRAMGSYINTPGMTRRQLERSLNPAFGPARASAIAVTETTRAYSEGTNISQRQLAGTGITMERVWRTSADETTCPICVPLNGKPEEEWASRFPSGPPGHVGCRCNSVLQLPSERMTGAFPAGGSLEEVQEHIRQSVEGLELDGVRLPRPGYTRFEWDARNSRDLGYAAVATWEEPLQFAENFAVHLRKVFQTGKLEWPDEYDSWQVLSHEIFHTLGKRIPSAYAGTARAIEEGLTEALARHYAPHIAKAAGLRDFFDEPVTIDGWRGKPWAYDQWQTSVISMAKLIDVENPWRVMLGWRTQGAELYRYEQGRAPAIVKDLLDAGVGEVTAYNLYSYIDNYGVFTDTLRIAFGQVAERRQATV